MTSKDITDILLDQYRKIIFFYCSHLYLVLLDILIYYIVRVSKCPALLNVSFAELFKECLICPEHINIESSI